MTTPTVVEVKRNGKPIAPVQAPVPALTAAEKAHEHAVYSADPTGGSPSRY